MGDRGQASGGWTVQRAFDMLICFLMQMLRLLYEKRIYTCVYPNMGCSIKMSYLMGIIASCEVEHASQHVSSVDVLQSVLREPCDMLLINLLRSNLCCSSPRKLEMLLILRLFDLGLGHPLATMMFETFGPRLMFMFQWHLDQSVCF